MTNDKAVIWWIDQLLPNKENQSHRWEVEHQWHLTHEVTAGIVYKTTSKGKASSPCSSWWSSSTSSVQCCCATPANCIAPRRTGQVQRSPQVACHLFRPSWTASSSLRGLIVLVAEIDPLSVKAKEFQDGFTSASSLSADMLSEEDSVSLTSCNGDKGSQSCNLSTPAHQWGCLCSASHEHNMNAQVHS